MPRPSTEDSIDFWRRYLGGVPPVLDLPIAHARRRPQPFEAAELTRRTDGLLADAERVIAALLVVLHRYSSQTDLVVGLDRSLVDPARPPGDDLVMLRTAVEASLSGRRLAERVAAGFERIAPHAGLALERIREAAGAGPSGSHHPLAQVVVTRSAAALLSRSDGDPPPPDLILEIASPTEPERLRVVYNAHLFERRALDRLVDHFERVAAALAADPGGRLTSIELVADDERTRLTRDWNATATEFPAARCLHHLFEDNADRRPDAVAAICGDESLTYAELEERANRLAHHLRALGVGPNRPVGICVERSLHTVVGLLAIAKAGGAYLPLDPSYPAERLAWMLADARLAVTLTLDRLTDRLGATDSRLVRLDADAERIAAAPSTRPDPGVVATDLAYVIYTSGSTGRPKGVVLDHRGRVNNFSDFNRRFGIAPGDRLIGLSSLSFDMTAYDVFGVLAAGSTLVLPTARLEREPSEWVRLIRSHQVTLWHSAPAMLEMLLEHVREGPEPPLGSLRLCLLGGDWIPVSLPDRLRRAAGEVRVVSLGGATEASMDSTIYEIEATDPEWTSIPYGRPMANQLAYVVDESGRPQPIDVPGELTLGGAGVAWGYLERPALTAEKFVPNPFSGVPGDRMYRTGDLARWHDDGNLELLGRIDHQVKIRGHRIELGEIEAAMKQHPAVREGVVVARGGRGGDRRLVGYVVPETEGSGDGDGWDREQIDEWRAVYDETYGQGLPDDPTFNIIGWNSSYTGLPIPEEEMLEWVEATVARIRSLQPRRVLEIGCGTGLLLFRLAPDCERYVGTDLSPVGLESIQRHLDAEVAERVELRHQTAEDVSGLEPGAFDVVVLNSITQLFPSVGYLLDVLEGAVERLAPGGFLFVGDNRDLRLLRVLHASIQLSQAPAAVPRDALPERLAQSMAQEEQLLLDPALFRALPRRIPRLSTVTIQWKRGRHHNELNRFRYDVIAAVEGTASEGAPTVDGGRSRAWRQGDDLDALRGLLAERPARALVVTGVPNARLAGPLRALEMIDAASGPPTAGDLRAALRTDAPAGAIEPDAVWSLGEELGFEVFLGPDRECEDRFEVVFRPAGGGAPPPLPATGVDERLDRPWASYGNQPLRGRLNLRLPGRLREFLAERLPEYMVPASVVLLDTLPLSPNGKVDRKSLPEPAHTRPELDAPLVAPRSALERVLASIWEETLGLDSVGVRDGFLELGGHSLLATQIQSRIHELFPVEIPLRHFFGALTIESLGATLRRAGEAAGVDVESAAELVLEYSSLSVEELESALAADAPSEPQP